MSAKMSAWQIKRMGMTINIAVSTQSTMNAINIFKSTPMPFLRPPDHVWQ